MKIVILLECKDKNLRQMIIPEEKLDIILKLLKHDNGKYRVLDNIIEGVEIK